MKKRAEKQESSLSKTLRITRDVVLAVILMFLVVIIVITLTARINGKTPFLFGNAVYRISSGSMEPYLQVGDIIHVQECDPMTLKEGDIITYDGTKGEFAGKRVTHRVYKEPYLNAEDGEYYLVTKGDNNPVEDSPIMVTQVLGRYVQKVEFIKGLYDFFVTPGGFLVIIALIIVSFANEIVIFVKTLMNKGAEEEQEDIQTIIERVQRENAAEQRESSDKSKE